MGLLDLHSGEANASVENPVEALPSTLSERLSGSAGEIFGPGRYFNMTGAQRDGWQQTIDQLQTATGETHLNPYGPVTPEEMGRLGNQPAITAERQQKIIQARNEVLHASGVDAGIADPQEVDRNIGAEQERRDQIAARLQGTGNGFGNFLGSMAMSSIEPVNAIGLLLPVGRMGTAAASAVGKTWLGEVAKEAGVQGAFNASLSAMTEGLDYATKETTGQPHSIVDSAGNVVQGAVFGAILGASVRGLHLMWTGLPPEVRAKAPTEVKDAFRVIENDTLYSGDNRLGIDPLLHDRYTANAADPVMRGRAPTIDDLRGSTGGMDTPMTALGTILSERPEQIRPEGLEGAKAGVRHLPDSELEPLLRETKPAAFAPVENIDTKLKALDERISVIHQEAQQIGLADVADIDTAARLQDIDQRLAAKGLRKATRQDLEREREMISQSIDPQGQLTEELKSVRKDFFPEHAEVLKQIEEERAGQMRERASAQSVLQTEIDQLRERVDKLTPERLAKGETGFETQTATVPEGAVKKADLDRQATAPFRAMTPGELRGAVARSERTRLARANDIPPDTTPQFDTTVREEGKRVEDLTPQELQKMADDTLAVLAKPGALGPMREGAMRDLELADLQAKDAAKVASCVMGAPL